MITDKKVARRKLSLLELTSKLSNVSKVCRIMGYLASNSMKFGGIFSFTARRSWCLSTKLSDLVMLPKLFFLFLPVVFRILCHFHELATGGMTHERNHRI